MSNYDTKIALRQAIKAHCDEEGIYYREVDPIRILTRCPFCGDSDNPNHAHFYIICDPETNTNAGYKCFKCDERGTLTEETLTALGINNPNLRSGLFTLNKTADKINKKGYMDETELKKFEYKLPEICRGPKTEYIEKRLGRTFTDEELRDCKVVTSLHRLLDMNEITKYRFNNYVMNLLEKDYVGFMSYGNSHVLLRDITGTNKLAWVKYPVSDLSQNNRVFYATASEIDPLTTEPITINIGEGVMDILSAQYNLGYNKPNTLNVCVSGKHYEKFLLFLLDLGFVGSNVTINVFSDNDEEFNEKAKGKTTLDYFRKIFSRFKYLYKEINVYWNVMRKDIGYPKDEIRLRKERI